MIYSYQTFLALWTRLTAIAAPTVELDDATVTGVTSGASSQFLGIPYAQPPVGDLRFRLPQAASKYTTDFEATAFGMACPQQKPTPPRGLDSALLDRVQHVLAYFDPSSDVSEAEDCLTINVVKPATATSTSNLPVVVWVHGGNFEFGGTSGYDGTSIVNRAIDLGSPVVYVSMNYRLNGFGFLASKEVKAAGVGNLGLQDQRLALKWVQKYISAFGGDPTKVTLWGESAGAISTSLHMVTNGGNNEGLFRAAFMQSGGPIPVGPLENAQKYYDDLVSETGCSSASDTLDCLRTAPYDALKAAIGKTPGIFDKSLNLPWLPRVDGVFLTESPNHSVLRGNVANVPFVTGNCDDEGTLFSFSSTKLSTTNDVKSFIIDDFLPKATSQQVDLALKYYPDDQRAGSPFDTGLRNALSPQYKRVAAFQGDAFFQAPRRLLLQSLSTNQDTWAFLSKRAKSTAYLGSVIGSDLPDVYANGELRDYLIRFAVNLDPNGKVGLGIPWPKYDARSDPKLLTFQDSPIFPMVISKDAFRVDQIKFITNLTLIHPM